VLDPPVLLRLCVKRERKEKAFPGPVADPAEGVHPHAHEGTLLLRPQAKEQGEVAGFVNERFALSRILKTALDMIATTTAPAYAADMECNVNGSRWARDEPECGPAGFRSYHPEDDFAALGGQRVEGMESTLVHDDEGCVFRPAVGRETRLARNRSTLQPVPVDGFGMHEKPPAGARK
jgi:hypothetical protein